MFRPQLCRTCFVCTFPRGFNVVSQESLTLPLPERVPPTFQVRPFCWEMVPVLHTCAGSGFAVCSVPEEIQSFCTSHLHGSWPNPLPKSLLQSYQGAHALLLGSLNPVLITSSNLGDSHILLNFKELTPQICEHEQLPRQTLQCPKADAPVSQLTHVHMKDFSCVVAHAHLSAAFQVVRSY